MTQFFQTGYGRNFFENQLPSLIKNVGRVADEMKRANDLKEQELNAKHQEGVDSRG
jgi:Sec-independent protein translocase protein TatA